MKSDQSKKTTVKQEPDKQTKRQRTDYCCLFLFVVCLVVWIFILIFAFTYGDILRLPVPTDSQDMQCGADKPNLYYVDLNSRVCVNTCPAQYLKFNAQNCTDLSLEIYRKELLCDKSILMNALSCAEIQTNIAEGLCTELVYKSFSVYNRCLPDLERSTKDHKGDVESTAGVIETTFAVFRNELPWMGLMLFFSQIICALFVKTYRSNFRVTIWSSIISQIIVVVASIYYSILRILYLYHLPAGKRIYTTTFYTLVESWMESYVAWLIVSVILSILLIYEAIFLSCKRKEIARSIVLIVEGNKCAGSLVEKFPFLMSIMILQLLVIVLGITGFLFLLSIQFNKIISDDYYLAVQLISQTINVLAMLWIFLSLGALRDMGVAFISATGFKQYPERSNHQVFTAIRKIFLYHFGTLNQGSFWDTLKIALIITLLGIFCKLGFYLWFVPKPQYKSLLAYILCSINGKAFFPSERAARSLRAQDDPQHVGGLFILLKLIPASLMALGSFLLFYYEIIGQGRYPLVPAMMVFAGTYFIAATFLNPVLVAVQTAQFCYLTACQNNPGESCSIYQNIMNEYHRDGVLGITHNEAAEVNV